MWVLLGIISALFLGCYDIAKKESLHNNAVIPVLTSSIWISAAILFVIYAGSRLVPDCFLDTLFYVPRVDSHTHFLLFLKAILVLASWISGYFAMKHLPITIVAPIRATQPVWVVVGAVLIFAEQLNIYQWAGVILAIASFWIISLSGRKEGISMRNNKYIWFIILATLTGAASALFDKYLLHHIDHNAVQCYFTFYQAILMLIVTFTLWFPNRKKSTPFVWRWSILLISLFLVTADFVYFYALSDESALIAVLSSIRRSGVVVPFLYGAIILRDKNIKTKSIGLVGIIIAIILLLIGR